MRKWSIRRALRLLLFPVVIAASLWSLRVTRAAPAPHTAPSPLAVQSRASRSTLDLVPLSTPALARISDAIALVRCRSVAAREEDGNIFTFTEFDVEQLVKGAAAATVTLRLIGGRVGNVEVPNIADLDFRVGRQYVLFMGKPNTAGYPTIAPQGVFSVRTSPVDGRPIVDPAPAGLPLWNAATGKPYPDTPAVARLDDFLLSLKNLR